jgi:FixJ family two-component response regulator
MVETTAGTLIAIVDDEFAVLSALSRLLRSHGYRCLVYESGESALADRELFRAQCIILDVQLPGIDGFELREKLRETGCNIPCVFITANVDAGSAEWHRRISKTPCLLKPFDEDQLITTLQRLLQKSDC